MLNYKPHQQSFYVRGNKGTLFLHTSVSQDTIFTISYFIIFILYLNLVNLTKVRLFWQLSVWCHKVLEMKAAHILLHKVKKLSRMLHIDDVINFT